MKISYSQIEESCNELHGLANQIKETLETVKTTGNSLGKNDSWVGDASDYYSNKINELAKNFEEIYIELENSILFMASCAEGYDAIDKTVIAEICNNLNIVEPNLSTSKIFN